jgi:hypothetical protein
VDARLATVSVEDMISTETLYPQILSVPANTDFLTLKMQYNQNFEQHDREQLSLSIELGER